MHCIFHHKYQSGVFLAHQLYHGTDPKEQENIHIIKSLHLKSTYVSLQKKSFFNQADYVHAMSKNKLV